MSEALDETPAPNTSEILEARDKALDALIRLGRYDVIPNCSRLDEPTRALVVTGLNALAQSLRLDEPIRAVT